MWEVPLPGGGGSQHITGSVHEKMGEHSAVHQGHSAGEVRICTFHCMQNVPAIFVVPAAALHCAGSLPLYNTVRKFTINSC